MAPTSYRRESAEETQKRGPCLQGPRFNHRPAMPFSDDHRLIDHFMPAFDVVHSHALTIHADAERTLEAVRHTDLRPSRIIRLLFRLRGLPRAALSMSGLSDIGFAALGETPGEEIVFGLVGEFWRPVGGLVETDTEHFRHFNVRGYAKAAWGFRVAPAPGGGVILSTETRVLCTSMPSRVAFRVYWILVRPFSGWVRREMLRLMKARAEGDVF